MGDEFGATHAARIDALRALASMAERLPYVASRRDTAVRFLLDGDGATGGSAACAARRVLDEMHETLAKALADVGKARGALDRAGG